MADLPPDDDTAEDGGAGPGHGSSMRPRTPRWVKVSGIIVVVLVLAVVIVNLTGVAGGDHGPGRHIPGGDTPAGQTPRAGDDSPAGHTPPAAGVDHAVQRP